MNREGNYSVVDGNMDLNINKELLTIERTKDLYCGKCGNKMDISNIYCNHCGSDLEKAKSKKMNMKNRDITDINYKDIISNFSLRKSFMTSISALSILLIISYVIKLTLIGSNGQISELINPLHILLFSNNGTMEMYMSSMVESGSIANVSLGLLLLLILPIFSLGISYNLCLKKDNISLKNHVRNSVMVGIFYGLILCIIAKISELNINVSPEFGQFGYSMYYGFTMSSVSIKGFLIGFITILLIGLKKEYCENNYYIYIISKIPKVFIIGYLVSLGLLSIMHFVNIDYLSQMGLLSYLTKSNIIVVLSQFAIYIWAFANMIPINIGNLTLSFSSIINSNVSFDIQLILGAFIAISALIFIMIGCKLDEKYREEGLKPVIVFSMFYSLFMGIVGLFTMIYIGEQATTIINTLQPMHIGFNFIISIITSFVYSFVMTFVGFKLNIFN